MNLPTSVRRSINRIGFFYGFGVNSGTLVIKSCAQFHRFYCGSLQMEVGNQTLVEGSINRLFIEERIMEQLNRA
jgi:hypothetical protein